jgi:hypothetical protein
MMRFRHAHNCFFLQREVWSRLPQEAAEDEEAGRRRGRGGAEPEHARDILCCSLPWDYQGARRAGDACK